jgi:hypothetical protein
MAIHQAGEIRQAPLPSPFLPPPKKSSLPAPSPLPLKTPRTVPISLSHLYSVVLFSILPPFHLPPPLFHCLLFFFSIPSHCKIDVNISSNIFFLSSFALFAFVSLPFLSLFLHDLILSVFRHHPPLFCGSTLRCQFPSFLQYFLPFLSVLSSFSFNFPFYLLSLKGTVQQDGSC